MSHRKIIVRLALWAVLFAVTLEVCARVDDTISYGASFWGRFDTSNLYMYDRLGKRGKPYAKYQKWKLNSLGYRGPDLQAGKFRIACVGSSETFGLYETEDNEWPRQLERELNRRANQPDFEVVNTAYAGMSIATSVTRIPEVMQKVQPKIVLIYPSVANYFWLPEVRPYSGKPPAEPKFKLRMISRIERLLEDNLPQAVQNGIRRIQMERAVRGFSQIIDRLPDENVQRFRKDMKELVHRIRSYGAEPVLITHATRFGSQVQPFERPFLTSWRRFYPMLKEDAFLDAELRMSQAMRELAANEKVMLIDAARQMPPGKRYFVEFVHFTDEGAHTLAKIVADGLSPLVGCGEQKYQTCVGGDRPKSVAAAAKLREVVAR
jgi:hypothetical protein